MPELLPLRPDPEASLVAGLRAAVAARITRLVPDLPPAAREALVSARARFLARWGDRGAAAGEW